jgi:hypothetical protein
MKNSKIKRNDPCPCGSGKKYKKCCIEKSEKISMKEIFDDYIAWNTDFEKEVNERTESEIEYDNVILKELSKGNSIESALKVAGNKYPEEALQYDKENIEYIREHYEYLLNHEKIKQRIQDISN